MPLTAILSPIPPRVTLGLDRLASPRRWSIARRQGRHRQPRSRIPSRPRRSRVLNIIFNNIINYLYSILERLAAPTPAGCSGIRTPRTRRRIGRQRLMNATVARCMLGFPPGSSRRGTDVVRTTPTLDRPMAGVARRGRARPRQGHSGIESEDSPAFAHVFAFGTSIANRVLSNPRTPSDKSRKSASLFLLSRCFVCLESKNLSGSNFSLGSLPHLRYEGPDHDG